MRSSHARLVQSAVLMTAGIAGPHRRPSLAHSAASGETTCLHRTCSTCTSSNISSSNSIIRISSSNAHSCHLFRRTRPLLRKPTIKTNPFATEPGKYDQSFEKLTETIESRLPFRQRHMQHGNLYDSLYGERSEEQENQVKAEDMFGKAFERPVQRVVKQYFSDDDESEAAAAARAGRVKAAQARVRPPLDKNAAKVSHEGAEYYYPTLTYEEKRRRQAMIAAGWAAALAVGYVGLRRLGAYMRSNEY